MPVVHEGQNILVTGIPRSGSTLLIKTMAEHSDRLLVFDEPVWLRQIRQQADPQQVSSALLARINHLRLRVSQSEPIALTYGPGNQQFTDNHFRRTNQGIERTKTVQEVRLPSENSSFDWLVKSNVFFTAVLDQLIASGDYRLIATVRNPVAVIKSWRSLDVSLSHGRSMIAEKYDQDLSGLEAIDDMLQRQVILVDWMFKKYLTCQGVNVIRYESFIQQPDQVNELIRGCQIESGLSFESHNNSAHYNHAETEKIISYLQQYGRYYAEYYPDLCAS